MIAVIYSMYKAILFIYFSLTLADIPDGYYDTAENLSGISLIIALHEIIDNHYVQSYSSIHDHFEITDRKFDNTVWDMYSDNPNGSPDYVYSFTSSDQCGNYSGEGDCYNREHSWPKSWFNNASPMNSDLFHLYPTDGYVNSHRGNYPYGDVNNQTWTSTNGGKKGLCSNIGYSGIVFEPIDEYKGDFARTYFYMSTRYYNEDAAWDNTDMTNGAELKEWAVGVLLNWHHLDPVSDKEINRNNEIYIIQGNRNPFIDYPEWVECAWTENCDLAIQKYQQKHKRIELISYLKDGAFVLEFNSVKKQPLQIDIINIQGEKIMRLFSGNSQVGLNQFQLNPQNFSVGVYFFKVNYSNRILSKKFIILK